MKNRIHLTENFRKIFPICFLLALMMLPVFSCNKEKEKTQPNNEMTGSQTSYFLGEIAVLSLGSKNLEDGTYSGSFGGKVIDWVVVNNKAVVIIPAVSEGNYPAELSFSGDVLKFNASVKAAPQVRTAQEYVDKSIERSISIKGRISDGTL